MADELQRERAARRAAEQALAAAHERLRQLEVAHAEQLEAGRQEAARAREDAETAARARTDFLAMMSHEMRTPLNVIMGMADLLDGTVHGESQQSYLQRIQRSSEALLGLIDEILDYARLDAGQLELFETELSPREIAEEVAQSLAVRAHPRGIEVVVDVDADLPERVIGDPTRLRQILANLVSNGIKFTERGEVVLSVRIDPATDQERAHLRYEVRDTGVGIPKSEQAKVFERFYRVTQSGGEHVPGTGLGLTICHSLVVAMGGTLQLESEPAQGSRFFFTVPHHRAPERPARTLMAMPAGAAVLVLARPSVAVASSNALLSAGIRCWTVDDEGIPTEWRETHGQKILLVDDHLSPMQRARFDRLCASGAPLVVALASPGNERHQQEVLGAIGVVPKPGTQESLRRAVVDALGRGRKTPHRGSPARDTLPPTGPPRLRVLLAEDDPDNRGMIQRILQRGSYLVDVARDGRVAFEKARRFRYDLVFTDLQMPAMDGFAFAAALREHEREDEICREPVPIVAVTAHALSEFRERAMAAGMNAFIAKPVKARDLLAVAARYVDDRPSVMVVDDAREGRVLMRTWLAPRHDLRVCYAPDGLAALQLMARSRVNLVLLDMSMPGIDGYETARRILAASGGVHAPTIVAVTGHTGEAERQRCLAAGCSDYLAKPLRAKDIASVLERWLGVSAEPEKGTPITETEVTAEERIRVEVAEEVADLVPTYLANRRKAMAQLPALLDSGNFAQVARIGHDMKGSGAAYGFSALTELGAALETAGRSADRGEVARVVARIESYLSAVDVAVAPERGT